MFRGYIDESYDNKQKLFALSCLITNGKHWSEMERAWKLHLTAQNKKLKRAGRPLLSRYHASDCSGRRNEFKGWTRDERDVFVLGLFGIFKRIPVHVVGYDMDLDNVCEVFPEWVNDRLGAAYYILTRFLLSTILDDYMTLGGGAPAKITLFHDRTTGYDATILRAFNKLVSEPDSNYAKLFTTVAPLTWEDCTALQPADLVAFEIFKEAERRAELRVNPRKSFDALLDLNNFGIHTKSFTKDTLVKMRQQMEDAKVIDPAAVAKEPMLSSRVGWP